MQTTISVTSILLYLRTTKVAVLSLWFTGFLPVKFSKFVGKRPMKIGLLLKTWKNGNLLSEFFQEPYRPPIYLNAFVDATDKQVGFAIL